MRSKLTGLLLASFCCLASGKSEDLFISVTYQLSPCAFLLQQSTDNHYDNAIRSMVDALTKIVGTEVRSPILKKQVLDLSEIVNEGPDMGNRYVGTANPATVLVSEKIHTSGAFMTDIFGDQEIDPPAGELNEIEQKEQLEFLEMQRRFREDLKLVSGMVKKHTQQALSHWAHSKIQLQVTNQNLNPVAILELEGLDKKVIPVELIQTETVVDFSTPGSLARAQISPAEGAKLKEQLEKIITDRVLAEFSRRQGLAKHGLEVTTTIDGPLMADLAGNKETLHVLLSPLSIQVQVKLTLRGDKGDGDDGEEPPTTGGGPGGVGVEKKTDVPVPVLN